MKINTHGMKLKKLKETCGLTKDLDRSGYGRIAYRLYYDTGDSSLITNLMVGPPFGFVVYDDPNIVEIGLIRTPMTMQEIADRVWEHITYLRYLRDEEE